MKMNETKNIGWVTTSAPATANQNPAHHVVGRVRGVVGVMTTSTVHDCVYKTDGTCRLCGFHRP
jgi:hypothetical protein